MISALNFKAYEKGALRGFFDLRYHGLTIKGCRLMDGTNGLWIAFPQRQGEKDGEVQYFDLMYLTPPERDHVRRLAVADLKAQGHIQPETAQAAPAKQNHRTFEGENLGQHYTQQDDDIPF
jgi:DNA-binding cell septation regulator SpoVG